MAPIRRAALRPDFPSQPTDLELATTYLRRFVDTGERPKFVHEANVYDASPGAIAAKYSPATASDGQEAWYFVTTLRSKSSRGRRKSRTVGSGDDGSWHSERAAKPLMAGIPHSRQIGYRQSFSFATKEGGRLVRSGWLMAEIGLNFEGSSDEDFVLCKVYRTPRIGPAPAPAPGANRSTAAAARGKEREYSASSEEEVHNAEKARGPARPPLGYSAQPSSNTESTESDTSDTELTESDSEQDSSIQRGVQIPRVITGNTARTRRSEAHQAPQIPVLPSSPIRRRSAAPGIATVPSGSDAPLRSFPCHPSDQELVKAYLIPRVASGENFWKFIHEVDVYTAEPAYLTGRYSPATATDGQKAWYFFSLLRAKSIHGRRRPRMVGSGEGCWHSESGARFVVDGGRRIGRRQFFSFMKKDDGPRVRTGWIMVEVGLDHGQEEVSSDELVLCKVYRSPRAGPAPEWTAASGRKRKAVDNNSCAAVKRSKAAAASARKGNPSDKKSSAGGPVMRRPSAARKSTSASASASSGRKRKANDKNSGAACPVLCARCQVETAESHSGTADAAAEEDETRGRSETGILEDNSAADDESVAPRGGDARDSSESARPPFYHFV